MQEQTAPDSLGSAEHAALLDRNNPLAPLREQFAVPAGPDGSPALYFCGHSLGLMPKTAEKAVHEVLSSWATRGVEGHFHGEFPWVDYHRTVRDDLATVVGAMPHEVVAMNSLTVNLHLLMVSFYRPTATRYKIVIERGAFPSDCHAVTSQLRFHGYDPDDALICLSDNDQQPGLSAATLADYLSQHGDEVALLLLPGIQYASGQQLDIAELTRLGHQHGCVVGWDLAHAVGNVPLALHDCQCDFAVWCHYKYLNSGPGAVGGAFVHERHTRASLPGFAGWWGHDPASRFQMKSEFVPAAGADAWQLSNPPVLALAPVRASLRMFADIGMSQLRAQSLQLTGYLEQLIRQQLGSAIEILTPAEPAQRGSQLSIRFRSGSQTGRAVFDQLINHGAIGDWREPDIIRLAPAPMYNTFSEVSAFVSLLRTLLMQTSR